MSRGLGKTQKAILAYLEHCRGRRLDLGDGRNFVEGTILSEIIVEVSYPERRNDRGEIDNWEYAKKDAVNVHRAIRALEARGLVKTVVIRNRPNYRIVGNPPVFSSTNGYWAPSRVKIVRLV